MLQANRQAIPDPPPQFKVHVRTALHNIRRALLELLAAADADPSNAQRMARRFGLNKNLTW